MMMSTVNPTVGFSLYLSQFTGTTVTDIKRASRKYSN